MTMDLISKDHPDSCMNKVMLNQYDNNRCYHLHPDAEYNKANGGVKKDLIHLQFSKTDEIMTVDKIEACLSNLGRNFHVYKETPYTCILNFEGEIDFAQMVQQICWSFRGVVE